MAVGFVVISDSHRRAIGKGVDVFAQYSLNGNNRLSSLCDSTMTNFNNAGRCFASFLHFCGKEEHSQYLVLSTSGKYRKVLLLPYLTFKVVRTCNFAPTMRASASVGWVLHCPTIPTIHTRCATFGQSIGEVVYALTRNAHLHCVLLISRSFALGKYCLLKSVSRFIICPQSVVT